VQIKELVDEADLRAAWPVMSQLRINHDEDSFVRTVIEMQPRGYRLLAGIDDGAIVALAGIEIMLNLYDDRHVWVYDLVTDENARSRGHGLELLAYIEKLAAEEGCERVALASGLQRLDAHRFYDRAGYKRMSYTFRKEV
jgi:GNAT superfamily N-acetyltransferase